MTIQFSQIRLEISPNPFRLTWNVGYSCRLPLSCNNFAEVCSHVLAVLLILRLSECVACVLFLGNKEKQLATVHANFEYATKNTLYYPHECTAAGLWTSDRERILSTEWMRMEYAPQDHKVASTFHKKISRSCSSLLISCASTLVFAYERSTK